MTVLASVAVKVATTALAKLFSAILVLLKLIAGAVISTVIVALFWLVVVLPAMSVCLTLTTPAA